MRLMFDANEIWLNCTTRNSGLRSDASLFTLPVAGAASVGNGGRIFDSYMDIVLHDFYENSSENRPVLFMRCNVMLAANKYL